MTLTLSILRMLTASVACDKASRWVFMSTRLFVWPGRKDLSCKHLYVSDINHCLVTYWCSYRSAGVGPLKVHPCVKLNQCSTVHGKGLPHNQLHRVFRKQLDAVHMTSWMGERKEGGGGGGGGRDGGTVVAKRGSFSFLAATKEVTKGSDLTLVQRSHPTIKKKCLPQASPFKCQALNH